MDKSKLFKIGIWAGIILLVIIVISMFIGPYNRMVENNQMVKSAWADVQTQYQRRNDLIPNLVNTVKGYAAHEQNTLTQVVEARAAATQTVINPDDLTPENMMKFQKAQEQVSSALSRLLVTVERYPDLKANQNFLELQAQLEGTENRIATARKRFNDAVALNNVYLMRFPNNMLANMYGFTAQAFFEASEEAQSVPSVQF